MPRIVSEIGESARVVAANARLRRLSGVAVLAEVSTPAYYTAAVVWAFAEGGAMLAGLFGMVAMVPAALVAPVAAVVTDRVRRDVVIVVSLALRGGFLLLLAAGMAAGSTPIVLAAGMVASMCARVLYPAVAASLPSVTSSRRELVSANALVSGIENVGAVAGPALAGLALVALPASSVCACAAVGTLASALMALRLGQVRAEQGPRSTEKRSYAREVSAGFASLYANPETRALAAMHTVHALAIGALTVLLVQVAMDDLRLGAPGVGMLETAFAVGGVTGGLVAVGRAATGTTTGTVRAAAAIFALPLVAGAVALRPEVVIAGLAMAGIANVLLDVVVYTHVQESTAEAVLARAMAALQSGAVLAVGLGQVVAGVALPAVGSRGTLAVVALCVPLAAATFVRTGHSRPRGAFRELAAERS